MSLLRIVFLCLAGLVASYGTLLTLGLPNLEKASDYVQVSTTPADVPRVKPLPATDSGQLTTRAIARSQPAIATLMPVPVWSPSMPSDSEGLLREVGDATPADDPNAWAVMGVPRQALDVGIPLDADDPRSYELATPSLPEMSIGDAVEADRGVSTPLGPKTPVNIGPAHKRDKSLVRLTD
jgi:hypothetical protein